MTRQQLVVLWCVACVLTVILFASIGLTLEPFGYYSPESHLSQVFVGWILPVVLLGLVGFLTTLRGPVNRRIPSPPHDFSGDPYKVARCGTCGRSYFAHGA